ncbi:MAG: iron(II)-dependent oxidoreductase [Planctomycetota bacterium]|jgi:iron(II)-dependent oxidoreductase
MRNPRCLSPDALCEALAQARQATLLATLDLTDEQWVMPYGVFIQPTAWDLGHLSWTAEFWLLRGPHRLNRVGLQEASKPPQFVGPDENYDSAQVCHTDRWKMKLYPRNELCDLLAGQLAACQAHIAKHAGDPDTSYFAHLVLFHELMHLEAVCWTRGDLGYACPTGVTMPNVPKAAQIIVPGGEQTIGKSNDDEFVFDNEGEVAITLEEFSIDSQPVRNDEFLAFVEDGGYQRAEFWPENSLGRASMPTRWRRAPSGSSNAGSIEHRHYNQWLPLPLEQPAVHISAIEAEAYCRWAGRNLPTAAQWETATKHGMHWGKSVWEWTDTVFYPYACFRPGPYVTYSAPWFHLQREVRGGAYTTHELMHDARYRNFFLADRTDVFTGFRTVNRR